MPYTSKAEGECNRWMTILEALCHIQGVERCGEAEALKQLCAALTDHLVFYSLTDEPPAPFLPSGISYAPEGPDPVWQPDKVNVAESRVWCDYGPHPITKKQGRNRPVLISQDAVRVTWRAANTVTGRASSDIEHLIQEEEHPLRDKKQNDDDFHDFCSDVLKKTERFPTILQCEEWGKPRRITRNRIRNLRKKSPLNTEQRKKGGRPGKNSANKTAPK